MAAGPYAVNIHGEFGRDAGNVAMTEMLTWRWWKRSRNDGPSFGGSWEKVYHTSHPFAGPGSFMAPNENLGFLDYNLDGLLDQGEVRVAGSENYMLDHTTATLPNGTNSLYPWNRRRLMEDVIEVLDEVVDFNDYVDLQGKQAHECNHGELIKAVPRVLAGATGVTVTPQGVVSGIVLLPYQAYSDSRAYFGGFAEQPVQQPPEPTLNSTTYYYPIHNEDNDDFSKSFPPDTTVPPQRQQVHWNAFFSDVVVRLATAGDYFGNPQPAAGDTMRDSMRMRTAYAAHDYLHIWEGFFDLFDYDALQSSGIPINTPIGQWDIMAGQMDSWLFGGRVPLNLVHSIPVLKAKPCTEWTDPIDLATVLTPGADTVLTLPPSELARDESYFFVENERFPDDGSSRIERLYLYSAGGLTDTLHFDQPLFPGFTSPVLVRDGMPASGLLILHTDQDANSDALPPQQRTGTHFTYQIVEADGDGELAAGHSAVRRRGRSLAGQYAEHDVRLQHQPGQPVVHAEQLHRSADQGHRAGRPGRDSPDPELGPADDPGPVVHDASGRHLGVRAGAAGGRAVPGSRRDDGHLRRDVGPVVLHDGRDRPDHRSGRGELRRYRQDGEPRHARAVGGLEHHGRG